MNDGSYISKTAGLDCSGFVSVAFQCGRYNTTSLISSSGPFKLVTDGSLKDMDILDNAGRHVVIHADSTYESGVLYYLIYEECATTFRGVKAEKTMGYACPASLIPSEYKRARIK